MNATEQLAAAIAPHLKQMVDAEVAKALKPKAEIPVCNSAEDEADVVAMLPPVTNYAANSALGRQVVQPRGADDEEYGDPRALLGR